MINSIRGTSSNYYKDNPKKSLSHTNSYLLMLYSNNIRLPCHFANKISYIFVEILIVVFAFKNTFNGSTRFSMRTPSLKIILFLTDACLVWSVSDKFMS